MAAVAPAVVHASDRTRVTRLFLGVERLRGVEGVARRVNAPQYPDSVVMEDAGPTTLAEQARRSPPTT